MGGEGSVTTVISFFLSAITGGFVFAIFFGLLCAFFGNIDYVEEEKQAKRFLNKLSIKLRRKAL